MYKGIAASPGIAIGKAFIYKNIEVKVEQRWVNEDEVEAELLKLNKSINLSKEQLQRIKENALEKLGEDKARIFEAHLMVLEDPVLFSEIEEKIKNEKLCAEFAVKTVIDGYIDIFSSMEDEYMRERAADIRDVGERIIKNILGIPIKSLSELNDTVIVLAKDLTPSDTAQLDKNKVLAFATDMGGRTSHTAIMARSLEIPAVVGLQEVSEKVKDGELVIVDGINGILIVNPDSDTLKNYMDKKDEYLKIKEEMKELLFLSAETVDKKRRVELSANIGTPKDVKGALENGAEGIGLYRTEFLYMDREDMPSEEEQYKAYKEVVEAMQGKPVIIRTLDIGGDKKLPYLEMPEELNPFLGFRAIRLCLDRKDLFKVQLRAILRASAHGKIRIMYPMISGIDEIRKANRVLEEAMEELKKEGVAFDENIEVGIMVEIPSAAVCADILAKEVDFFSIGTNDLIQYTLAVDRMNEKIAYLYEPFHPAIIRLIKNVIDASHREGKWTGMCGEMAGEPLAVPLLLGLGLDEFSMSATAIPFAKKIIRSFEYDEAKELAEKVLLMESAEDIRLLIKETCNKKGINL
ncbi:phosphoenolpyruvate--protein phosphotransferase [Thermovenabulum gondwanense]|uniref:Phosphoenolpyruvate-protein phosphotransferase n=1 Tax=Thermovenabulum gondwanense TaxID=520767 RepID=A0A162MCE7_9FIRM|nr:phosphoenolpyruvate--protein phosphotransferase [Thermovenabulum gondwanense]KYO65245.1 Phosphoenolpyruvate-protein phosphotransferase [Thermovenabulum gondwanense]